jgi:hypothetical protein
MRLVSLSGPIATGLAIVALAAPSAQAIGFDAHPASTPSVAAHDQAAVAREPAGESAAFDRIAQAYDRDITPTTTRVVSTGSHLICAPHSRSCLTISNTPASSASEGFQLGDAAIGAGVMLGLMLLGAAGVLVARPSRELRHP